ncbi:MAG TPA: OsmC family peroxiredoxin [Labilithrix sp.]|nr:OsmC family peroxiredoxin [Labilithrix sp.]
MGISKASASWDGDLKSGRGTMKPDNAGEIPFSLGTRFEGVKGSNPEEVIGAALAGCFSMALSLGLEKAGMKPERIRTEAKVHLDKAGEGFAIKKIELTNETRATGGDEAKFKQVAEETKKACPVSKALAGVSEITLDAKLAR